MTRDTLTTENIDPFDIEGPAVCGAVHHDRLTDAPTWCKLATGHDGMHDDGALRWEHHEHPTIGAELEQAVAERDETLCENEAMEKVVEAARYDHDHQGDSVDMTACADCGADDGCIKPKGGFCDSCADWRRGYDQGAQEVLAEVRKRDRALASALVREFPAWKLA